MEELRTRPKRPGECGNPDCRNKKVEGHYVCEEHLPELLRIKKELEEDPNLAFNQRTVDSEGNPKKNKRPPTCSFPGCFDTRVPPSPYCFAHENEALDEDYYD